MAGCATRTNYAGHSSHSATADHKLTYKPDHPMGADQRWLLTFISSNALADGRSDRAARAANFPQ